METKGMTIWAAIIGAAAVIVAALITSFMPGATNGQGTMSGEETVVSSTPNIQLPFDINAHYIPSGWMGDGEFGKSYLSVLNKSMDMNGELVLATRIEYLPGPKGWAGIYWQFPENNWGDLQGRNLRGAKEISFWAKGEIGGEVVEFKVGGIRGKYSDTLEKSTGKVALSSVWKKYTLNVASENLKNVAGGFAWVSASKPDKTPLVIYLAKMVVK